MSHENEVNPNRPLLDGLDPQQLFNQGMVNPAEALPNILGFELRSKLGEGGMGTVYRAWQQALGREVALKLVRPTVDADFSVFERLEREARSMAAIEHPHIVEVYDFFHLDDGSAAIVMKLIEGETLRTLLERSADGMSLSKLARLMNQIGEALSAAHRQGLVHRDVKPENILIDLEGNAHVTDFGLALPIDEASTRLTRSGTSVGTLAYIAPEQLECLAVDAKADQFSFAVMIYEMLTGIRPRGVVEPPHKLRKGLSPKVSSILLRAMSRKPSERWSSVDLLVKNLYLALRKSRNQPSRRDWIIGSSILGGMTAIGATTFALTRNSSWNPILPHTDPDLAMKGSWYRDGKAIVNRKGYSVLQLPVDPSELTEEYDVSIAVSQKEQWGPFALCFQAEQGFGSMEFHHKRKKNLAGIQKINGVMIHEEGGVEIIMEPNKIYQFILHVRKNALSFSYEGQPIKTYPIGGNDHLYSLWHWSHDTPREGLAIAAESAPTHFHNIAWQRHS